VPKKEKSHNTSIIGTLNSEKQTSPHAVFLKSTVHLCQWPIPGIQNPGGRADN